MNATGLLYRLGSGHRHRRLYRLGLGPVLVLVESSDYRTFGLSIQNRFISFYIICQQSIYNSYKTGHVHCAAASSWVSAKRGFHSFPFLGSHPVNPARRSGERCELPSGSERRPTAKCLMVHFELKIMPLLIHS